MSDKSERMSCNYLKSIDLHYFVSIIKYDSTINIMPSEFSIETFSHIKSVKPEVVYMLGYSTFRGMMRLSLSEKRRCHRWIFKIAAVKFTIVLTYQIHQIYFINLFPLQDTLSSSQCHSWNVHWNHACCSHPI